MNKKSMTLNQVLKIAVKEEIKAYNLYDSTSKIVKNPGTKTMLLELAREELNHQKLLENIIQEKKYGSLGENIPEESMGIADFSVTSELDENATTQEAMIFAMKEEEKAYNFYTDLKSHFAGTELEKLFNKLALEEKGHKIKLEDEYEEGFLKED